MLVAQEPLAAPFLRLSVVVATTGSWDDLRQVLDALRPDCETLGVEVIAVKAGATVEPERERRGVRYVAVPDGNLFAARARGVMSATGDVIALLEDHSLPEAGWASAVLAAWNAAGDVDALIHSIAPTPQARTWELALFTVTFGPFMSVSEPPRDRLPVPGHVSFRRSLLPPTTPAPGWVEYELLSQLVAGERIAMTDATTSVHVQPASWRTPRLSFDSGRTFAGTRLHDADRVRSGELRRFRAELVLIWRQSLAARRRCNSGVIGRRFVICLGVLIAANAAGQLVGIASRSAGGSPSRLE